MWPFLWFTRTECHEQNDRRRLQKGVRSCATVQKKAFGTSVVAGRASWSDRGQSFVDMRDHGTLGHLRAPQTDKFLWQPLRLLLLHDEATAGLR